jgi:4-amino-4-deoxy-L-arabinose transferase-like glycosyltransferase
MAEIIATENHVLRHVSRKPDRRCLLVVFGVACIAFLPFLGSAGMFDPTDSFFIEAGREMLETHRFIVPLMNYEQWLDKPALDFCLIAASLGTFGINEFAGRLPSALSSIVEVVVLFILSSQLLTRRQAFLCSLVLAATPLFIVVGRTSLSDEPLSLFLTTCLLSFAVASIKKSSVFLIPAYAALGVAILLKGPPLAMVLTGLVVGGYLIWSRHGAFLRDALKLHPLAGLAGAFVIAAPYYIWAHLGTNGEFTTNFFLRQNLGRAAGTVNHVRPFWWYFPIVFGGTFPWSISLLFARKYLRKVALSKFNQSTQRQELLKFAIAWVVLGFVFFSAVPTKLETYIVPILPALAILAGCFLDVLVRVNSLGKAIGASGSSGATHKVSASRVVASALFLAVSVAAIASPIALQKTFDKDGRFLPIDVLAAITVVLICAWGGRELNKKSAHFSYALVASMFVLSSVFIPVLFVAYNKAYQQPVDELVSYAKSHNAGLAVAYFPMPSVIYRYGHAIPVIKSRKEMLAYAESAPDRRWILINKDVLDLLDWTERSPRVVACNGRWWLFAIGRNCRTEDTVEWHGPKMGPYPEFADKVKGAHT